MAAIEAFHEEMDKISKEHVELMLKNAKALREKAVVAKTPGYSEQLIQAADDLEKYASTLDSHE